MRGPEVIGSKSFKIREYVQTNFMTGMGFVLAADGMMSGIDRLSFLNRKINLELIAFVIAHPHFAVDKFVNDITLFGLGLALYALGFSHIAAYAAAGRYKPRSDGDR